MGREQNSTEPHERDGNECEKSVRSVDALVESMRKARRYDVADALVALLSERDRLRRNMLRVRNIAARALEERPEGSDLPIGHSAATGEESHD